MKTQIWTQGTRVIAINNINIDGIKIKKGTIGIVMSYKIGFGSNQDYYNIYFDKYGIYEFTNYDKKYIKIYKGNRTLKGGKLK